ncbi:MAG: hypothetical protein Q8936_10680 [Bacillota bacterium]|nr:hypothetical protein [Bacillota bacterium]
MIIRKSFSIPYNRGEIWVSCLDGLGDNIEILKEKVLEDEKMICRPSTPAFVALNLNETTVSAELAAVIVDSLIRSENFINKLTFVGVDKHGKRNIEAYLKKSNLKLGFASKYFDDFEKAKEWLI